MPTQPIDTLDGTLVLRLAYDGAGFSGFAEQPGQRTVAGETRRALETFLRRSIDLTCAGRTDAGVHARAQYVSVPLTADELAITRSRWMRALSALLPDDVAAGEVFHAAPGFSARFDARARTYTYRIGTGEARPLLCREYAWWHRTPLDIAAMEEASRCLVGEHDFKSFCKATSALDKPTCRYVGALDVKALEEAGESLVAIDITGNAFLPNMVRTIAGSLVEVGRGHRRPEWMSEVLAACDRRSAGPCAPAKGLTFVRVEYPAGALAPWN